MAERRLSKAEFEMFLGVFAPWKDIKFSASDLGVVEAPVLSAELRRYDRVLADKFDRWYAAVTDLGTYVSDRIKNDPKRS